MVVLCMFRFSQSLTKFHSLSFFCPRLFDFFPLQSNYGTIRRKLSDPWPDLDGVRRDHDVDVDVGRWSTAARHATRPRQEPDHQESRLLAPPLPDGAPPFVLLRPLHRRAHANARRLGESQGGLEVRGDGAGPSVLMDFHAGRAGRNCRNHPAGPDALRRPNTHRQEVLGLCFVYGRQVRCNSINSKLLSLQKTSKWMQTLH